MNSEKGAMSGLKWIGIYVQKVKKNNIYWEKKDESFFY